jgi:hypothetical protein
MERARIHTSDRVPVTPLDCTGRRRFRRAHLYNLVSSAAAVFAAAGMARRAECAGECAQQGSCSRRDVVIRWCIRRNVVHRLVVHRSDSYDSCGTCTNDLSKCAAGMCRRTMSDCDAYQRGAISALLQYHKSPAPFPRSCVIFLRRSRRPSRNAQEDMMGASIVRGR